MNRLARLPLLAAHEVLKTSRMLIDAATVRRYYEGWEDGFTHGVAHALAEKERSK